LCAHGECNRVDVGVRREQATSQFATPQEGGRRRINARTIRGCAARAPDRRRWNEATQSAP
jgi:hypothetical protein